MKNQKSNIFIKGDPLSSARQSACKGSSSSTLLITLAFALVLPLTCFAGEALSQSADPNRLDAKAGRSTDLYVEPDFNFQTYQSIMLNIWVTTSQSQPVNEALLSISSIADDIDDLSDERLLQKSLLSYVRTDRFGRVYQTVELSNSIKKVLIELDIQGPDSKRIVDLTNKEQISHVFISE